jgi:Histidine kinase-like ATPase domain
MTVAPVVNVDLDSGALVVRVGPDDPATAVRAALVSCADQHPQAVIIDLRRSRHRAAAWLRRLARLCARRAVPLLVVPVLAVPGVASARLMGRAPLRMHRSLPEAIASLPHALTPAGRRRIADLSGDPSAPWLARRLAMEALTDWGLTDLGFAAELIVSELVSNSVRHAGTDVRLLVRLERGGVRIAVHDGDPTAPRLRVPADPDGVHGRGLHLVAAVAANMGVLCGSRDKVVWALLSPRPAGPAATLPA